ncbi:MAG: leucine--tRNA ligase [Nanoarchaeota archaeon]|nr:leucine--tRNA ligase [Nanoarchaeota archaeon]MBU1445080.1 leucine--tRNA ligase [Nanoarchaeota archaeon]MBU2420335.1 leucine--tRNA ligase [Nanoarchaeota archaeon]MBU2474943.1 leucine--tRNA ligase [Nanoarchaeota archaeon]
MVNLQKIESKWQKKWEDKKIFQSKKSSKKKFYCLEMYPYPSGSGLHMGHVCNYVIGDVCARFKRMNGFNVLYPMGYDSFGLPAENAAIKNKTHPKIYTEKSIKNFIRQQKEMGLSYDWSRTFSSHQPEFYKWDQWLFLKLYEKGLAYKKKAAVNWCPKCNTVLANEQVVNGKCWRHTETEVEIKELNQWFFKTTDYADKLLDGLDKLEYWPEDIKTIQRNWIGKSQGIEIHFKLKGTNKILPAYTTRPDTIFSVTFVVLAPEHPLVLELVKGTKYEKETLETIKKIKSQSIIERTTPEGKDKIGCFLGKYVINPANNEEVPLYIANFCLVDYGTGIVMADAHDQRDFEFAKKYKIPLKFVISKNGSVIDAETASEAYTADGILFNSEKFSGMKNQESIPKVIDWLEKKKGGKKTTNYRLRDWLISRQRYWGCPIPIIYCNKCGLVPVPEKDLPVKLPEKVKFGDKNPLETNNDFVNVKCPKCKKPAKRETDTMDTFIDSSWYFFRYCDNKNNKKIFDKEKIDYWMPIDQYIGGREHATGHLIYSRFITKFLKQLKLTKIDEPFLRLFNQGMLHKDGVVMSKSKGNTVSQEEIAKKYGIDTARFFLMFISSPDKDKDWNTEGVQSAYKSLIKIYSLLDKKQIKETKELQSKTNKTIKEVTKEIENFNYNIALIKIMDFVNYLTKKGCSKNSLEVLAKLISPFTPHLAEEMWEKLGNKPFISLEKWPKYDPKKIDEKFEAIDAFLEQTKKDINNIIKLVNIKPKKITIFVSETWKYNVFKKIKKELEKTRNTGEIIKNVMDKKYGKEIPKIVTSLVKNPNKIPDLILDQKTEIQVLKEIDIGFKIQIIPAEKSKENKAKQASPGKVAILVK